MPKLPNQTWFFIENNGLPFDNIIKRKVQYYVKNNPGQSIKVKSIYYENKEDIEAFQTYNVFVIVSLADKPVYLIRDLTILAVMNFV